MLSLKLQIWCLLQARSSLTLKQTIECGFMLRLVHDMMITYNQMQHADKYSQHSTIIWPVWLNGWVFIQESSGCGFTSDMVPASSKEFLAFRQTTECGFNLKLVRDMITTYNQVQHTDKYSKQLNHLASLAKWLSVCLWTKWLWVWILLLSLKLQIWHLLRARNSLTFSQTTGCQFTWNSYMTW